MRCFVWSLALGLLLVACGSTDGQVTGGVRRPETEFSARSETTQRPPQPPPVALEEASAAPARDAGVTSPLVHTIVVPPPPAVTVYLDGKPFDAGVIEFPQTAGPKCTVVDGNRAECIFTY